MKRFLIPIIFMFMCGVVYGAAPTRPYTYTSGETIDPDEVTTNEENLYTYVQGGVDVIKDGTIVNADVNTSADIAASKLDSTVVETNTTQTITGTKTFSGTANVTGTFQIDGNEVDDTGATTFTTLGTIATGTWQATDIGYQHGGTGMSTATDDNVIVGSGTGWETKAIADCDDGNGYLNYDTGTNAFSCGTSGRICTLYTSGTSTHTTGSGTTSVYVTMIGGGGGGAGGEVNDHSGGGGGSAGWVLNRRLTVEASTGYTYAVGAAGTAGAAAGNGGNGGSSSFAATNVTITCAGGAGAIAEAAGVGASAVVSTGSNNSGATGGAGGLTLINAGSNGGTGASELTQGGGGGAGSPFGVGGAGGDENESGFAAIGFGTGGGGGGDSSESKAGGAGGSGFVLVCE